MTIVAWEMAMSPSLKKASSTKTASSMKEASSPRARLTREKHLKEGVITRRGSDLGSVLQGGREWQLCSGTQHREESLP